MHATSGVSVFALTATLLVTGAPAALAVCDPYSESCVDEERFNRQERQPAESEDIRADRADTLPFTGGEAVLMALVGLGAIAGGTVLVVSARRREAS